MVAVLAGLAVLASENVLALEAKDVCISTSGVSKPTAISGRKQTDSGRQKSR